MAFALLLYYAAALTTLICFFYLCYNVYLIRKRLVSNSKIDIENEIKKAICFGDKELAKEKLKDLLWMDIEFINKEYPNNLEDRLECYQSVKKRTLKYLEYLNMEFPA